MNRDFKGVWIPKEIWLNENLTMLEKVIFVEIDSLDNENHCVAGNEYFAEFCNCSESKVSKAIKKLKELNMIEEVSFDGRHRKIRVVKSTNQSSKKYEAESQNLQSNNIDNKQENKKNNSKELLQNSPSFEFGRKPKVRESLYTKCVHMIDEFISQHNCGNLVRKKLLDYLNYRLSVREKPLYVNMWKGMLAKLDKLHQEGYGYEPIVDYAIERGYLSFYPPVGCYSDIKEKPWEKGVTCEQYTEEELMELEELNKQREAQGLRTKF